MDSFKKNDAFLIVYEWGLKIDEAEVSWTDFYNSHVSLK